MASLGVLVSERKKAICPPCGLLAERRNDASLRPAHA